MELKYNLIAIFTLILSLIGFIIFNSPKNKLGIFHSNLGKKLVNNQGQEMYDFIIIGAGTSGSILANRLSFNRNVSVLLLEAGGVDADFRVKIPALFSQNFETENDWGFYTTPQESKGNYSIFVPSGKLLGGSSSINAMIYLRGSAYDYDEWERMGFKGWNYENMLKYFKKSERQLRKKELINEKYHGFNGEWMIDDVPQNPVSDIIINAFKDEWNLTRVNDFNEGHYQKEGIGYNQANIANGERHSLSDAFLTEEVLSRVNLYIKTHSIVTRLLIEGKKVIGVEIQNTKSNEVYKIYCKKEVILSAGAYNTPKILQLSGIGDEELLKKHNISVVLNNPHVGQNLQDHPTMGLSFSTKEEITLDYAEKFPYNIVNFLKWVWNRGGLLKTNVCEINGFVRSSHAKRNNETAPDFQILGGPVIFVDHGRRKFQVPGGYSFGVILLNQKSRGSVNISSSNPLDPPIINTRTFSVGEDFDKIKDMINILKLVSNNPGLKEITQSSLLVDDINNVSDEEMTKLIHEHSFLLYHHCCTAAMGKVVDDRLKVYGIENLRVVDTSIMPIITRCNTNAPTAAIAEKGADMIYEDNLLNDSKYEFN